MSFTTETSSSSTARRLILRKRPDLVAKRQVYLGSSYWIVKEPLGLKYFRFHEEEYAFLQMLDGQSSLNDIRLKFQQQFAPQRITLAELQQLISMMHKSGLLVSDAPGQGEQLLQRRQEQQKKKLFGVLSNVLAIRWRGIDPDGMLEKLRPIDRWLFWKPVVFFFLMLALAALTLVFVRFDGFRAMLPSADEFFGPGNWLYLALCLGAVKVLHEFGHGMSCKHFGGECHEMGFMLLVFTPCLYCNVSDSWLLPNKWQRAAIGAAGMYVEMIIASIATFIWFNSDPGLLNHLCLSLMFICSISTLLFNGNPLMRFDGYYILADILEIPNLRQKASETLRWLIYTWCLGLEMPEDPFLPKKRRWLFAAYTVASFLYRWFIMASILLFLNSVLEPYGLQIIGRLLAVMGIFGLVVQPLWQMAKFLHAPGRMHEVKKLRVFLSLGIMAAIGAAIFFIPLPHYVRCGCETLPKEGAAVFITVPGKLAEIEHPLGASVNKGEVIARLENPDLVQEHANLVQQREELGAQVAVLRRQRFSNTQAAGEIGPAIKEFEAAEKAAAEIERELAQLKVVAPRAGVVMAAPSRPPQKDSTTLSTWQGSPFEKQNMGAHLEAGVLLCYVGQPDQIEARLLIEEAELELIKPGQLVWVQLNSQPWKTYESKLEDISAADTPYVDPQSTIGAGGKIEAQHDASGRARPLHASYQGSAPLTVADPVEIGIRGTAKIYTGSRPLGVRLWRYLSRTFHFVL